MELSSNNGNEGRLFKWGAVAATAVAVVVRMLPWRWVFSDHGIVLPGTDPYYHIWRAWSIGEQFPSIPVVDPFVSFPFGAAIPWPPGFDLLVALPGILGAGKVAVVGWGAVLMPLLGGLSVYLVYRLGCRTLDPACALIAAWVCALMMGSVHNSPLGRVDHHGLVGPVTLGMFLAFLGALRTDEGKRIIGWSVGCAGLAALSVASWIVTPPLYFLVIPLSLFVLRWTRWNESARRVSWWCLGMVSVLVVLVVAMTADLQTRPFVLYQPSWFTVMLFAGMTLAVLPVFYGRWVRLAVWGGGIALLVAMLLVVPQLLAPLREALGVVAGDDPSYQMAAESRHPFFPVGYLSFEIFVGEYTHLGLLAPFLWAAFLWTHRRQSLSPPVVLLGVYWLLGLVFLGLQIRFGEFSAPALSLLFGWFLVAGGRAFFGFARAARSKTRPIVWGVFLVAGLAAALSPVVTGLVRFASEDPLSYRSSLLRFAHELDEHIGSPVDAQGRPRDGILAAWNESHALLYATHHPVMISSFATPDALRTNRIGFGILLSPDEDEAARMLREHRIRYLFLAPILTQVDRMARFAGIRERFVLTKQKHDPDERLVEFQPLRPFAECLHTRLYLCDGSSREVMGYRHRSLGNFRLLLESRSRIRMLGSIVPKFKVFEFVPGARLQGATVPGQPVEVRLEVVSNTGRRFTFTRGCRAGPDGVYSLVVPYATSQTGSAVVAQGAYRVHTAQGDTRVEVDEQAIRHGMTVRVAGPSGAGTGQGRGEP